MSNTKDYFHWKLKSCRFCTLHTSRLYTLHFSFCLFGALLDLKNYIPTPICTQAIITVAGYVLKPTLVWYDVVNTLFHQALHSCIHRINTSLPLVVYQFCYYIASFQGPCPGSCRLQEEPCCKRQEAVWEPGNEASYYKYVRN